MSINSRTRLAALGLVAAFAIGACSSGSSTAAPAASQPAAESMAPGSSAPGASEATAAGGPPECLSFADIYALVGPESEDVQTWDQAATIAGELGSNTAVPRRSADRDHGARRRVGHVRQLRRRRPRRLPRRAQPGRRDHPPQQLPVERGRQRDHRRHRQLGRVVRLGRLRLLRGEPRSRPRIHGRRGAERHVRRADGARPSRRTSTRSRATCTSTSASRSLPRTRRSPPMSTTTWPRARSTVSSRRCPTFP